jgi:hypothetical protein
MLKTMGYMISTASVLLLAAAAWPGASRHLWTLVCLMLGASTSIGGMACRWTTYVIEHRAKLRASGRKGPIFP